MKIVRSEFGHEYQSYRFGYCEHAMLEPNDSVADFYEKGFLPYSADPNVQGVFYMARSARVTLPQFEFSSENRRVGKRFDGMFSFRSLSIAEAKEDSRIRGLFLDYFRERHGKDVMPAERFDAILNSSLPLRILVYEKNRMLVAAVLEVTDETFAHFWFSAYDLSLVQQSLGMWLMLDAARRAKDSGIAHYYVGTVYGAKALYKTNLEPLEFWDGSHWNIDLGRLKKLARAESK
ncbi:MAG: GNAT family N-acetyltransferase [Candidatus Kaiserbacteria bacterium]|nr:GNAT family N-acetyltransferase [Candidatus Kaiserbacteria bacterium]